MLAVIAYLPLAFWSPGPGEMLVLAVVALLLYGGNLPEVARSWGKTFAEFRRGLSGFQNEFNSVIYNEPEQLPYQDNTDPSDSSRDDSRFVNGYEETSYANAEEPDDVEPNAEATNAEADEFDESERTVNNAGADTVVIEPNEDDHVSEEKPA